MTLEEKVGQLFWARVPSSHQIEDLRSYHLSGYILFGRDFEGRTIEDMKALTTGYQDAAKIPLLIGSDEEGGDSDSYQFDFRNSLSISYGTLSARGNGGSAF